MTSQTTKEAGSPSRSSAPPSVGIVMALMHLLQQIQHLVCKEWNLNVWVALLSHPPPIRSFIHAFIQYIFIERLGGAQYHVGAGGLEVNKTEMVATIMSIQSGR